MSLNTDDVDNIHLDKRHLPLAIRIFFIAGIVSLGCGAFLTAGRMRFERHATQATGVVVENTAAMNSADNQVSYQPKIRFQTREGQEITVISSAGRGEAEFRVGEEVAMLYDPQQPTDAMINTFWHRWLLPIGAFGFGFLLMMAAIVIRSFRPSNREVVGIGPESS
jgi:hypothetical protein